jgi:tetratricopeptide (TPR) repeat protein
MRCFLPQFRFVLKSLFVPAHILIVLLFTCLPLTAQTAGNAEQDSLKSFYKQLQSYEQQGKYDLYRGEICNKIASYYLKKNNDASLDSARKYSFLILSVAKAIANPDLEAQARLNFAMLFDAQDSLAGSIQQTSEAVKLLQKNNETNEVRRNTQKGNIALALGRLGSYYYAAGDIERSLKCTIEATEYLEQISTMPMLATSYANLSAILLDLRRFDEAIVYARKGIAVGNELKYWLGWVESTRCLVDVFVKQQQFDSAWKYATLGLRKSEETENIEESLDALIRMAEIRSEQGRQQEVLKIANTIIERSNSEDLPGYLSDGYLLLAKANFALGNFKQAETLGEKAFALYKIDNGSLTNVPETTADFHKLLADIYKQEGNFAKAFFHFERQATLRDSLLSAEKQKQLNIFISINEMKRKEAQLVEFAHTTEVQSLQLQQKNTTLISVSIGAVLAVLLGVLFYRQRRLAAEKQIAETEQRLLRTRLNPHLWFNALSSVQHHLVSGANPRSTAQYLSKIASVMRQSLESSYQDTVSISEEVEFAEKYLNIQQMRLEQAFEYSVEIHEAIDPDSVRVPSMLLEPFLENTIEHGFRGIEEEARSEKARICIAFEALESQKKKGGKLLSIKIEDNGNGLQRKQISNESSETQGTAHRSRAVEITKERLRLLAPKRTDDVGVTIAAREQGGVMVHITLPLQEI